MTTCRDVIRAAYRKAGITALGASISTAQANLGLELLSQVYMDLVQKGTLGRFTDVYKDEDYTIKEFERVYTTSSSNTITIPTTVTDEVTNQTRAPLDGAVVQVVGPSQDPVIRIYDALSAAWENPLGLTLTANAPLCVAYRPDIEALLAALLADENGIPIGPVFASMVRSARFHLARRDNVASAVVPGTYF